uniref:Trichome birefringence-like N-terminal domain-containing protein n=1 Tax=Kalanchoe fedtschenkoi TaxID=63787 RepID=A0A7N0TY76_KALFE
MSQAFILVYLLPHPCLGVFCKMGVSSGYSLPVWMVMVVCAVTFVALLYTETLSSLSSGSFLRLNSCPKKKDDENDSRGIKNEAADDRFEFDPSECSVTNGKWVFNSSFKPLYSDESCPHLDRQVACVTNGRPDSDYRFWEWQLEDCVLPRFDPKRALHKIRGKRLMFVGDSLQRGQWQSFVCLVESVIPQNQKSMRRGRSHSVFKIKQYNATVEFYWAPFLVESNSDLHIIGDPKQRILRVDSVEKHARNWHNVDILVFNTYVWWMSGLKIKSLWGSFANGEEGFEELDAPVAYRIGLKTWANWVDSNVNPKKTRVFFTTMSPTHMRRADWSKKDGIRCYNETKPILKKQYWGSGSDQRIMKVVSSVVEKMKVAVTFINVTQLSEHRIDAHTSVYTEVQGSVLTAEEKAEPLHYADCIHWCLPGVPDTWNQLFLAYL